MGRTGPKNLPGRKAPVARAPRVKSNDKGPSKANFGRLGGAKGK